jgi:hypothetical protein
MTWRVHLHAVLVSLILVGASHAIEIKNGMKITDATKAMKDARYRASGLSLDPIDPDDEFSFWSVDGGVLTVTYSLTTKKIVRISYSLSDWQSKASTEFTLSVKSFDLGSGSMVIQTKKPTKKSTRKSERESGPRD